MCFIGDGAGVGKGRTIAGCIFENFLKGRKRAIWVSVSNDLKYDSERDLKDIGASKVEVYSLNKVSLCHKETYFWKFTIHYIKACKQKIHLVLCDFLCITTSPCGLLSPLKLALSLLNCLAILRKCLTAKEFYDIKNCLSTWIIVELFSVPYCTILNGTNFLVIRDDHWLD